MSGISAKGGKYYPAPPAPPEPFAGVETVTGDDGITVDNTDPQNPIVINDGVITLVAGDHITIDDTDPQNPIIATTGIVETVTALAGNALTVDNTDPANPVGYVGPFPDGALTLTAPNGGHWVISVTNAGILQVDGPF